MTKGPGIIRAWFMRRAYDVGYRDGVKAATDVIRKHKSKTPTRPDDWKPA